ncbi:MAG: molybdenum cofactor biosynthesis protein B [Myxococcota bacterium]|jgi:molybdenum cofactor biosynthesis protein B
MPGIDESRPFVPINIAVLTVSDTRTEETDRSGAVLVSRATDAGHIVVDKRIIRDDVPTLVAQLRTWIADDGVDVVLATGGTGLTGRDVTPEAFSAVWEKEIPGFGELFRWQSYAKIGTSTIQSRACAGVARGTYLFAVPGSTGACKDAWDGILAFQLDFRYRPCNFVEIMPRLREHEMSRGKV